MAPNFLGCQPGFEVTAECSENSWYSMTASRPSYLCPISIFYLVVCLTTFLECCLPIQTNFNSCRDRDCKDHAPIIRGADPLIMEGYILLKYLTTSIVFRAIFNHIFFEKATVATSVDWFIAVQNRFFVRRSSFLEPPITPTSLEVHIDSVELAFPLHLFFPFY
jgi:hypothetical protein